MDEIAFNLLDPCSGCIDFDKSIKHETNCIEILNSTNDDKHYEYFWITFKNSIIPFLGKHVEYIKKVSFELNELQRMKEYDKIFTHISIFMVTNIETIAKHVLQSKSFVMYRRFDINLKRWNAIDTKFFERILDSKKYEWTRNIRILARIGIKQNKWQDEILEKILNVYDSKNYDQLFMFGIEHNLSLVVDMCYPHVDRGKYFKCNGDVNKYENAKGQKIIRILKYKLK